MCVCVCVRARVCVSFKLTNLVVPDNPLPIVILLGPVEHQLLDFAALVLSHAGDL